MSQSAQPLFTLKLTAAVVLAGALIPPGTLVEVEEGVAKNLLSRNKADLASEAEGKAEGVRLSTVEAAEAEARRIADEKAAQDAAILEHVLKSQELTLDEFEALSDTKRRALLKNGAAELKAA